MNEPSSMIFNTFCKFGRFEPDDSIKLYSYMKKLCIIILIFRKIDSIIILILIFRISELLPSHNKIYCQLFTGGDKFPRCFSQEEK